MNYATMSYVLVFLPAVVVLYKLLPQRHRWKLLLAASYLFYWLISKKLIV